MIRVLVTGANGQLGNTFRSIAKEYSTLNFVFTTSDDLDITNIGDLKRFFKANRFDFCVNCAAYTNVEQAEKTPEPAYAVNADGAKNVALACKEHSVILIHISTDYVFDGEKETPYTIDDKPNPINEYGKSKLLGETKIQETLKNYHIVRTSWLYSEFGKNFYKTILHKAKTEKTLYITDEQMGCPTNARNLAAFIIEELILKNKAFGMHHFTDGEAMSWYTFAKKILHENKMIKGIRLERAKDFSTFAKRPGYSVLK